jgi:hypothetical protein
MLSQTYVMLRSAEGASRTTRGGRAAPGFRFETNSFTRSFAGATRKKNQEPSVWFIKAASQEVNGATLFPYLTG